MIARFTSIGITLAVASVTFGGTIRVPADAPTIQIAISEAVAFDTIIVGPGRYFETIDFGGKIVTLQSTNPSDPVVVAATVIDADGPDSVVTFSGFEDPVDTVLDGFTITGGSIGIDGNGSRAIIRRCVVGDNSSFGISMADGRIEDCLIRDNNGAGLNDCGGVVERCVIRNNKDAGAMNCRGMIVDTVIEDTRRGGFSGTGSGVHSGSASLVRCTIRHNSWSGVFLHGGNIVQSSISGNAGSGIEGLNGDAGLVENSTITGNGASGVIRSLKSVLSCTLTGNREFGFDRHVGTISHVILWDNQLGALSSSTVPQFSAATDPLFVQPGAFNGFNSVWIDGDYHLAPDSPFIDAGDAQYLNDPTVPIEDRDGNPRVVGARIDIGAFESQIACAGLDFDADGTPDACDLDIDDDGVLNVSDACDFTPSGIPINTEGRPLADLNMDCIVDLQDFAEFQRSMFGPPASALPRR